MQVPQTPPEVERVLETQLQGDDEEEKMSEAVRVLEELGWVWSRTLGRWIGPAPAAILDSQMGGVEGMDEDENEDEDEDKDEDQDEDDDDSDDEEMDVDVDEEAEPEGPSQPYFTAPTS